MDSTYILIQHRRPTCSMERILHKSYRLLRNHWHRSRTRRSAQWKQIKMMFTGEDRQALQTMIDNNTITPADQCTPVQALKAIQTSIKDEEHYWHYGDEILSNIRQQPEEQVHALNNRIITLVNNCSFQDQQTTETIKIMFLQHTIRYHKACNWIRQQDPAALTYKSLLQHCKSLKQRCQHYRKAQQNGELN